MHWLNLRTSVVRATEFVSADPVARATWISVSLWAAEQENGGRIVGAAAWRDRQWQQSCGVTLKEVNRSAPLLVWDGDDLIVWAYPVEQEEVQRAKRLGGRAGGLKSGSARARHDVALGDPARRTPSRSPSTTPSTTAARSPSVELGRTPSTEVEVEGEDERRNLCVCESDTHTHGLSWEVSIESLKNDFPDVNLEAEIKAATRHVERQRGAGAALDLRWFREHWLPRVGPKLGVAGPAGASVGEVPETKDGPDGWRGLCEEFSKQGEPPISEAMTWRFYASNSWSQLPRNIREYLASRLGGVAA